MRRATEKSTNAWMSARFIGVAGFASVALAAGPELHPALNASDRDFLESATSRIQREIDAARFAAGKASSDKVRQFAQETFRDRPSVNADVGNFDGTADGPPFSAPNSEWAKGNCPQSVSTAGWRRRLSYCSLPPTSDWAFARNSGPLRVMTVARIWRSRSSTRVPSTGLGKPSSSAPTCAAVRS
jgi:hypothetical protein